MGDAFWATFGSAGFALGVAFTVLIMLAGRLRWLTSILAADMWLSLSNILPTFNMVAPLACLWFYLSTSYQLNYTYVSQLYYFSGNLALTLNFTLLIGPLSDFPVQTLIKMPYNLIVSRVTENINSLKESMAPLIKIQNASTYLSATSAEVS